MGIALGGERSGEEVDWRGERTRGEGGGGRDGAMYITLETCHIHLTIHQSHMYMYITFIEGFLCPHLTCMFKLTHV